MSINPKLNRFNPTMIVITLVIGMDIFARRAIPRSKTVKYRYLAASFLYLARLICRTWRQTMLN